jgi:hypothetical protein
MGAGGVPVAAKHRNHPQFATFLSVSQEDALSRRSGDAQENAD